MKKLSILMIICSFTFTLFSQDENETSIDDLKKDAIKVYTDASSFMEYMIIEIPFINLVREKEVADLIIIETKQKTGSGGSEITLFIEGQFAYSRVMDTLKYHFSADDTMEEKRSKSVKFMKIGLMKYIIGTPLVEFVDITFSKSISEDVSSDKWKNWVFESEIYGSLDGRESSKSNSFGTAFDADWVTNEWKINIGLNYDRSFTEYNYGEIQTTNTVKFTNISGDVVKSLGNHWAIGLSADVFSSIYSNFDIGLTIEPVIEYDIFPYSESTRKIFRIFYIVGLGYNNYTDTTQFFKIEETLLSHQLQASFTTIQKWGNIDISGRWSNYLNDFSLNRLSLRGRISLKIARGLRIVMTTNYTYIHDQVSLRKGDGSIEDVLLQRYELSTSYSYRTSFGLMYTFGSIYNNVVNPRLDYIF